jgi:hypothetical protein
MADEYIKMATYFEAVRRREKGRVITAADLAAALTGDPEALDVHLARPGCRPNAIEKYDNAGSLGEPNELPETSSFPACSGDYTSAIKDAGDFARANISSETPNQFHTCFEPVCKQPKAATCVDAYKLVERESSGGRPRNI